MQEHEEAVEVQLDSDAIPSYESPAITFLGSVDELTAGTNGGPTPPPTLPPATTAVS